MNAFEKKVFMEMIEGDLQQAWELLNDDQFDLAVHHFEAAVVKAKELRDVAQDSAAIEPPQQPTLEI